MENNYKKWKIIINEIKTMNIKQSIKMLDKRANDYLQSPNLLERILDDKHISENEYDLFIEWVEWVTDKYHYHNVYLAKKIREKEYNLQDIIDLIKSIDFEDLPHRDSHYDNGVSPNDFI
tara:strand:- start:98 stop:457 length:360 start_codon:yes stop_codon:yes gene_type:complete